MPQYEEVIRHGVNGFLVDDNGAPLSESAIRVLSDAVLRRAIAERNRRIVEEQADQDREMARMEWWYGRLSRREGLGS
jgi:glycosyltransferase involved in cell wall biosynthesis